MQETDPTLLEAAERFAHNARALAAAEGLQDNDVPSELAELLALLAEQPEWRLHVDGTRNFGHQASSVALLRRLIELTGFAGRVVVVYVDYGRALLGRTADKLALMFAGMDPARIDEAVATYGTCRNIRFLPFDRRAELREMAAFGFSGGADDMTLNLARELNVRFFARVQPYLWDDPPSASGDAFYECSRIEQPDDRHLYLLEACPKLQHLAIKPSRPCGIDTGIWRWYMEQQVFDDDLARRTRSLRAVLTTLDAEPAATAGGRWLWPVYGLQHFKERAAEMVLTCALAAARCARKARRSVVLSLFSPHQELDDWSVLVDALATDLASGEAGLPLVRAAVSTRHASTVGVDSVSAQRLLAWTRKLSAWASDAGAPVPVRVHRSYDPRAGRWADISPALEASLCDGSSPTVHVVELGPVPMDAFHHCLVHADLPPVIEGQATANLLTGLGKPFLQVLREENAIKNGYATPTGVRGAAVMAETAACVAQSIHDLMPHCWTPEHPPDDSYCVGIERIARFVLEAQDMSTGTAAYFEGVGRYFASNRNDKLLMALLGLREVVLSRTGVDGFEERRNGDHQSAGVSDEVCLQRR